MPEVVATEVVSTEHKDRDSREAAKGRTKGRTTNTRRETKEQQLQEEVRTFVRNKGGDVDGRLVASEVAQRFNEWIRTDSGRNDGKLRKWISAIPGISVEN